MDPRTKEQLLSQLRKMLPGHYVQAEPLLAGFCAALENAESVAEVMALLATIEDGEGMWLTLQARGLGIKRGSGESDESLRTRLRIIEDQVTKPAIKAAVDRILDPDECEVIEWFDQPYLDYTGETGAWLDNPDTLLSGGPSSFIIRIPKQSTFFDFGEHLDISAWLDSSDFFLGDAPEDPVYAAIINEVNRIRAAGVFWRLVLEE